MIIGCYYGDGSPVEEVNLHDKGRAFELEACVVKHPRRYPEYNVGYESLTFCATKEGAEKMMNEMQDMITACMVGDLSRMNSNYDLKYQEDDKQYIVSITPRNKAVKDYVSAIEIRLSKADMSVDQLRMYENEADYTDYRFTNKRFNQLKDESRFSMQ